MLSLGLGRALAQTPGPAFRLLQSPPRRIRLGGQTGGIFGGLGGGALGGAHRFQSRLGFIRRLIDRRRRGAGFLLQHLLLGHQPRLRRLRIRHQLLGVAMVAAQRFQPGLGIVQRGAGAGFLLLHLLQPDARAL